MVVAICHIQPMIGAVEGNAIGTIKPKYIRAVIRAALAVYGDRVGKAGLVVLAKQVYGVGAVGNKGMGSWDSCEEKKY